MSEPYVPTTDDVREDFALPWSPDQIGDRPARVAAFDRWLSEHDRQVAERAWDEAVEETHALGWLHDFAKSDALARNPYRAAKGEQWVSRAWRAPGMRVRGGRLWSAPRLMTSVRRGSRLVITRTASMTEAEKEAREALAASDEELIEKASKALVAVTGDWQLTPEWDRDMARDEARAVLAVFREHTQPDSEPDSQPGVVCQCNTANVSGSPGCLQSPGEVKADTFEGVEGVKNSPQNSGGEPCGPEPVRFDPPLTRAEADAYWDAITDESPDQDQPDGSE